MLACDIGEAASDVGPAVKHYPFDIRAHRRECCANIIAAVEQRREARAGYGFARGGYDFTKPAWPHIAAGARRAGDDDRPAGACRRLQRRNRLGKGVNNNDRPVRGIARRGRLILPRPACAACAERARVSGPVASRRPSPGIRASARCGLSPPGRGEVTLGYSRGAAQLSAPK